AGDQSRLTGRLAKPGFDAIAGKASHASGARLDDRKTDAARALPRQTRRRSQLAADHTQHATRALGSMIVQNLPAGYGRRIKIVDIRQRPDAGKGITDLATVSSHSREDAIER